MTKSKFSKKQIAGTLLLSSTAIGATASGTASANLFTDFLKNGLRSLVNKADTYTVSKIDRAGEILESEVDKIGNKVDGVNSVNYTGKNFGYISDKASAAYNGLKGSIAEWVKDSKIGKFIGNSESTAYKYAWGAVAVGLLLVLGYGAYKVIKKNAYKNSKDKLLEKIRIFIKNLETADNSQSCEKPENIEKALAIANNFHNSLILSFKGTLMYNYSIDDFIKAMDEIKRNIKDSGLTDEKIKKDLYETCSELYSYYLNFSEKKLNYFGSLDV